MCAYIHIDLQPYMYTHMHTCIHTYIACLNMPANEVILRKRSCVLGGTDEQATNDGPSEVFPVPLLVVVAIFFFVV